jgi:hypothetical protein
VVQAAGLTFTAYNMGFAAMAGRRNKLRLFASIGSSSGVTNNAKQEFLSSTNNKTGQRFKLDEQ